MEAELFSLFDVQNLKKVFEDEDPDYCSLKTNFARFLSAYFANLPLVCAREPDTRLPSLFLLSNLEVNESSTFRLIARHKVAANLRASYTPQLAVRLLVNCDLWLEVCLFVDHFNDLRSALIVRHLVDLNCGLTLVDIYCSNFFVNEVVEHILDIEGVQYSASDLSAVVDACTELAVLFDYNLVDDFIERIVQKIEDLSSALIFMVPEIVALPRSLIYESTSESSIDFNNVPSELFSEYYCWEKIRKLLNLYVALLLRTNRLETLVVQITVWLCRLNVSVENEVPLMIEAELPSLDANLFSGFQRVLLVVLRLTERDVLSLSTRQNQSTELIAQMQERYDRLCSKSDETFEQPLVRWAETADQRDFDCALRFFRSVQKGYGTKEKHLPFLSRDSLERWQVAFNAQSNAATFPKHDEAVVHVNNKLKVNQLEFGRLQFLSTVLTPLNITDPSLVQIALRLQPTDFCSLVTEPSTSIRLEDDAKPETVNSIPLTEFATTNDELRDRIRASIRRLGRQTLATRAADARKLPALLDSFNRRLSPTEHAQDIGHLQKIRQLTMPSTTLPTRSLTARELTTKTRQVQIRNTTAQTETLPAPVESTNLSDELRMISARLANLRERWSTPENWANRQQPTIPVKTVQNSSDDSIKEQSLRPQHQKKQKRRKRRDRHRASAQPTPPLSSSSCDRADSAISRFQETRKLLGLSNEQKASPSDQWPFDFGERSLADERVIHSVKSQNDKTEESVGAKKHSIEKKEASLDYVPAPIPTPLTPESIGRLNLAQLTDDEERDSKLNWSEVEVYERSSHVPNETNSVTKTKRIPKTQKPKKSEISKQSNEHRFPEWLRLVPREDRTSSSRLLKVDFNAARRETLTARQTIFIDKNTNVLDSGVVVETPRNGIAGLSFPMSPESVRRLIALCDEQNL